MAVKGPTQHWYSSLKSKFIHSWEQLKTNLLVDFQGFQPTGLMVLLQATAQRTSKSIL
jgi:hypothetical protein